MELTEKPEAVTKLKSVALESWRLYFSEMPYRMTSPRSLHDPASTIIRPAENNAAFSEIDVSGADHLL
jgi:hypothetical protein